MSALNLNIKLNPKFLLIGLLIAVGVGGYVVKMKDARAAVGATGLTGKYSCISNRNFAPMMTYMQNSATIGANFLTIMDFDAHTMNSIVFTNSNWNQGSVTATTMTATGTFTEATGPIAGSYKLSGTVTAIDNTTSPLAANILLANSGNTYFYSVDASANKSPESGVCQKQ